LDEIPTVPVTIFKHDHGPVCLNSRLLGHPNATRHQASVIGREIVCVQEEANAPTSLPADGGTLLIRGRNSD
jgi:hypothetical protein